MPIYEYECRKCGQIIEELQKFSDPPLKKCPDCGGKVNKLMSMNSFHLKGSGWYVTDYARKGASCGPTKSESPTKTETKTVESASKTETKAEA